MHQNFDRRPVLTALGLIALGFFCGCGASTVSPGEESRGFLSPVNDIREFLVELAEGTGKFITRKASTLTAALKDVWNELFPERDPSGVKLTSADKLRGEYPHQIRIKIIFPKTDETGAAEIEATLGPPVLMRRRSINDPFEIAPENYPAPFRAELKNRGAIEE